MKQILTVTILSLVLAISICHAQSGGKDAFINKCGACHKIDSEASPVNPGDKAAVVWKKYFKRRRHPVDLSSITADDMANIIQYLRDHAADSEQPESAVIPN